VITRDEAKAAETSAAVAEAEAQAATEAAAASRLAAQQAAREADEQRGRYEREMRGIELKASKEIGVLKGKVDQLVNLKVPSGPRPSPDTRSLARRFLHMGLSDYAQVERLSSGDHRFAELHGLTLAVQQLASRTFEAGITDETLCGAIDQVECTAWRALVARASVLAGES
jgi:hypothetical protein